LSRCITGECIWQSNGISQNVTLLTNLMLTQSLLLPRQPRRGLPTCGGSNLDSRTC